MLGSFIKRDNEPLLVQNACKLFLNQYFYRDNLVESFILLLI